MKWTLHTSDCLEKLREMRDGEFDAVLCDPPYGLGFMGKAWDHGVPSVEVWAEVLRVLKPGAHLLAFGGTRTFHRLTCAVEDAGFEVRDCLMWLYGSGFPKSLDISKALDKAAGAKRPVIGKARWSQPAVLASGEGIMRRGIGDNVVSESNRFIPNITSPATDAAKTWNGYGTALKPAWEPCIVAMKPTAGTYAENALKHGVAGINVEAGRIAGEVPSVPQPAGGNGKVYGFANGEGRSGEMSIPSPAGRWPANLILDESFDQGWSKFFYCAKASRRERDAGLDGFEARDSSSTSNGGRPGAVQTVGHASINGRAVAPQPKRNTHPCLKPLDLNRYLASLILPPERDTPRRILVPFSGSGSEMIGALLAGWDEVVGIEKEQEYCDIANARLNHWCKSEQKSLFE